MDLQDLITQHEAAEQAEGKSLSGARIEAILARISAEVTKAAQEKRKPVLSESDE